MQGPRPLVAILALAALAVCAFVAANLIDEELTPEARALFAPVAAHEFARESGWALIAGFSAPVGQDPRDYAQSRWRTVSTTPEGRRQRPLANSLELAIRAADELLCKPESMDCARAFAAKPGVIRDAATDNAVLLQRYDELLQAHGLGDADDAVHYYSVWAPFALVLRTQSLRLSQVGAAAAEGRIDQALAWLDADGVLYRRWLDESASLISTMIALRGLEKTLLVAGQVARAAPGLGPTQVRALERIAAPLTQSQWRIGPVMHSEARGIPEVIEDLRTSPKTVGDLLGAPRWMADIAGVAIRRNATLNFAAPTFGRWPRLDGVRTASIASAIEEIRAENRRHLEPDWTWAYNYVGRAFVAEGAFDAGDYAYRLRDGDALAALVRCVVALRESAVTPAGAAAFIASAPACRDPYLDRPFGWDGERSTVSFKAGAPRNVARLGGADGRVTFAPYPR